MLLSPSPCPRAHEGDTSSYGVVYPCPHAEGICLASPCARAWGEETRPACSCISLVPARMEETPEFPRALVPCPRAHGGDARRAFVL